MLRYGMRARNYSSSFARRDSISGGPRAGVRMYLSSLRAAKRVEKRAQPYQKFHAGLFQEAKSRADPIRTLTATASIEAGEMVAPCRRVKVLTERFSVSGSVRLQIFASSRLAPLRVAWHSPVRVPRTAVRTAPELPGSAPL